MAQLANWQIGEYFTQGSEVLSGESVEWAWRWMFCGTGSCRIILRAFFYYTGEPALAGNGSKDSPS